MNVFQRQRGVADRHHGEGSPFTKEKRLHEGAAWFIFGLTYTAACKTSSRTCSS